MFEFEPDTGDQWQELFDRLSENCVVQTLLIDNAPPDLAFLFRLRHLIRLEIVSSPIDIETVRRAFEELPVLSYFMFKYDQKNASIEIGQSEHFQVWVQDKEKMTFFDLNAAIEFIVENQ